MAKAMEIFEVPTRGIGVARVQGETLTNHFAYTVSTDRPEGSGPYEGEVLVGKRCVVTHIPTGAAVDNDVSSKAAAKRIAEWLETLEIDWSVEEMQRLNNQILVASESVDFGKEVLKLKQQAPKRKEKTLFERISASKAWKGSELREITTRDFGFTPEPQPCAYIVHPSGAEAWVRLMPEDMT